MPNKIKVVLFTEINSKLGSPFLRILSSHPMIELVAVVTSPHNVLCSYFINDKYKVDVEAEANVLGIKVMRPNKVSSPELIEELTKLNPYYFIVANFQQLLTEKLLSIPNIMPINFHPSPLPRYAGLAPFYWIIRNNEKQSAISVIKMDDGLDTGPIIMQRPILLDGNETGIELRTLQEQQNTLMLLDLIPLMVEGNFSYIPQNMTNRTYFGRPTESDYLLNFNMDAKFVVSQVKAAYRTPGAHFYFRDGTKLIILSVIISTSHFGMVTPGKIKKIDEKVYISTKDKWLEILTIDVNGEEISASAFSSFFNINEEIQLTE
ncbi:methionyl-tRNA formyltransferase [Xenorhabdus bovienii]|uniref:methionyl-tRNA formyltransferase n=1 Tax=Xenorhabdus bovienii TaxID=40576 RepID=UPI0023B28CC3|nr:formyltransferase family protein [Xenorhabdus bovienii]MDE9544599.1 hypothetical protein [Xenorhabdus bovienii]